jgi:hypothetical protein
MGWPLMDFAGMKIISKVKRQLGPLVNVARSSITLLKVLTLKILFIKSLNQDYQWAIRPLIANGCP